MVFPHQQHGSAVLPINRKLGCPWRGGGFIIPFPSKLFNGLVNTNPLHQKQLFDKGRGRGKRMVAYSVYFLLCLVLASKQRNGNTLKDSITIFFNELNVILDRRTNKC